MRILALLPILADSALESETRRELARIATPNVEYTVRSLEAGPASIESEFDDRVASPYVLDQVVQAEREGFDAVFVSCMGDVATNAARELVRIPVVAPYQTCMAVASTTSRAISSPLALASLITFPAVAALETVPEVTSFFISLPLRR